jgi:hypothetical protein
VADLAPFTAVSVRLAIDPQSTEATPDPHPLRVAIAPGDVQRVVVDATDGDAVRVVTTVHDGRLMVELAGTPPTALVQVSVTVPAVTAVSAAGGAVATVGPGFVLSDIAVDADTGALVTAQLQASGTATVATASAADADLAGTAAAVVVVAQTGSSVRASQLATPTATVTAETGATVEVAPSQSLVANASTGSRVVYQGSPLTVSPTLDTGGTVSPAG